MVVGPLRARGRLVMSKGDPSEHKVHQLARLFDLDPPPGPRLWTAPRHERAAEALIPPGAPVLAIGPAANWRGKQWRAERFAALALRLTAADVSSMHRLHRNYGALLIPSRSASEIRPG